MAIKLAGYTRVEEQFSALRLTADYVAVEEDLERPSSAGIVVPRAGNTKTGTVLRAAPDLAEMVGIREGDRVVFAEWQGGRWAFADDSPSGERKCLIMASDGILARIEG
jgi:co-chaperonin GroES (HSP10)